MWNVLLKTLKLSEGEREHHWSSMYAWQVFLWWDDNCQELQTDVIWALGVMHNGQLIEHNGNERARHKHKHKSFLTLSSFSWHQSWHILAWKDVIHLQHIVLRDQHEKRERVQNIKWYIFLYFNIAPLISQWRQLLDLMSKSGKKHENGAIQYL